MARDFTLDVTALQRLLEQTPEKAGRGAKRGLHDSLDDWVFQSRNVAPLDKATLRRGITPEGVTGTGLDLKGTIQSLAKNGDFNYAYYIHELNAGGKNVGGVLQYLDETGEQNKEKWMRWIEEEIEVELRRAGW